MTTAIEITWKAFQHNEIGNKQGVTSATIEIPDEINVWNNNGWCELLYEVTNLQDEIYDFTRNETKLFVWNLLKPLLPANRTHTSLSVGDEVTIAKEGVAITYRCESFSWEVINAGLYVDEYSTEQLTSFTSKFNAPIDARSN